MTTTTILFPLGMRLTTWVCVLAFVWLAIRRRDVKPLAAGWVWLLGFEAAFDISRAATGHGFPRSVVLPVVVGTFTVAWFARSGPWPSRPWLYVTALIWIVWLAVGFPDNLHTLTGFDAGVEVLNVGAKTALALAYFVPLLARRERGAPTARVGAQTVVGAHLSAALPQPGLEDAKHQVGGAASPG